MLETLIKEFSFSANMHVLKTHINGNPNVGLYGFATDNYCLLGKDVPDSLAKQIEEVLKVPVFQLNIAGTSLLGVFLSGNNSTLLVPSIAFETEIKALDKISKKTGLNYRIIETELTALGNNVVCSKEGCMVNPDFPEDVKKNIADALDIPVKSGRIADLPTVGSVAVLNKEGCAIHRDAEQFEEKFVSDLLKVECRTSTVNLGNPFLRSGILVNGNGFIVGDASGGPEVVYLDEIFGFIEG